MKWIRDSTGRFAQRPHFEPDELDIECERLVTMFLRSRHGRVAFPISNDDLQVLVEEHVSALDLYADLSDRGEDVEGVTIFDRSGRPEVLIARQLTEQHWSHHRLRTTLTHELGHVQFHNVLYQVAEQPMLFAGEAPTASQPECHRDSMQSLYTVDWMEWQAGYACGAFLIPQSHALALVKRLRDTNRWTLTPTAISSAGKALIAETAAAFDTSEDAARVRLIQLHHLAQ